MFGRYRGVMFLVLALVGALTVTMLIYNVLSKASDALPVDGPKPREEVVVAATDVPPGWTIKTEHLATRQLPETYIPDEVYRTAEEVIGRVAMERVLAGEFIREERLADPEAGQGLTAIIPRGMRAMQVPVKGSASVSGFLNPGNFVDVLAVCTKTSPPQVRTLLQSVTVLAVNDRMTDATYEASGKDGKGSKGSRVSASVTLALTPKNAEIVKHAFSSCKITLTLRNDIDVTNIESNDRSGSDGSGSFGPSSPAPAPNGIGPDASGFLLRDLAEPSDFRNDSTVGGGSAPRTARG